MVTKFISIWALFFGIALITIGNGLQGTLLGVRGTLEGFSTGNIGAIMSCYYGGFLLGSLNAPKLVRNVGHIRVFAAFASLASVTILAHSVVVIPWVWGLIRLLSGFAFAGLFVVAESWLNDQSTNENRGRILSIYMAINHGGFFLGQLFLNLAAPREPSLFILISILLSFALIPILVTVSPAPNFEDPCPVSIKDLYHISPSGLVGGACVGIAHGSVWGMGPVFALRIGFDIQDISLFMGAAILGGFLFQWPIGMLSDKFDRRAVINNTVWAAGFFALVCACIPPAEHLLLFIGFLFFGACSLPLYSLCIAHTNDHLSPNQMVGASSAMILVYGAGALLGPAVASLWMIGWGPFGLFVHLFFIHILLGTFLFFRIQKRPPVPLEKQEPFTPLPPRTSPVVAVLSPDKTGNPLGTKEEIPAVDASSI